MYFFDIADYIGTCFFGPNSLNTGDPEDSWGTYRETRNAWLKALNQYYLSFTACATCSSTIIGAIDVEIVNAFDALNAYKSSEEYAVPYALFYNMVDRMYVYPGLTILEHNTQRGCPDPMPVNFNFFGEGCIFTGLHNVPIINTAVSGQVISYVNNVDFGNAEWSLEIFNDFVNSRIQEDCLFVKFLNLTTNNLIKESEMTNFNQIV
jgi:hypothetical protein